MQSGEVESNENIIRDGMWAMELSCSFSLLFALILHQGQEGGSARFLLDCSKKGWQ